MITQIYGIPIFVTDQDRALEFYRDALGFIVTMDVQMESFRWLTVSPKDKPDTNFILGSTPETQNRIGSSSGIVLYCDDIHKQYDELIAKGVKFVREPTKMPFGEYLAVFADPDGNTFQLVECR